MRGMLIVVLAVLVGCAPAVNVETGRYTSTYGAKGKLSADILAGRIVLANKPSRELWLAAAQPWMTVTEREQAISLFAQQDTAEAASVRQAATPAGKAAAELARARDEAASAAQFDRGNEAHAVCQYHGRMAAINNQTPALIDLHSMAAGGSAYQACLDLYRQTGIIPGA